MLHERGQDGSSVRGIGGSTEVGKNRRVDGSATGNSPTMTREQGAWEVGWNVHVEGLRML
jgi:hypothetical protein